MSHDQQTFPSIGTVEEWRLLQVDPEADGRGSELLREHPEILQGSVELQLPGGEQTETSPRIKQLSFDDPPELDNRVEARKLKALIGPIAQSPRRSHRPSDPSILEEHYAYRDGVKPLDR